MKRDMDLIRRIALETEKLPTGDCLEGLAGVEDAAFSLHVTWMEEAGLIKSDFVRFMEKEWATARVLRLTWQGCEFVEAVRNDTLWAKAKEYIIKPTASFTFGTLTDWLKQEITNGFPTLRGAP